MSKNEFKAPEKNAVKKVRDYFNELKKPIVPTEELIKIAEESTAEYEKEIEKENERAAKTHTPELTK